MRDLNYNHLRYFWAVAHAGGLTPAAKRLNLSQSALSIQLQKLEHQIGHPLFERAGKKLVLTEAGRIALDYADTVFKAGEELLGTLRGRASARRQILSIGALTTLSRNFQLEFLKPLIPRSDVELVVRSGALTDLVAQLETHEIDIVLANSPAPREGRSTIRNHLIAEQPVSLISRSPKGRRRFRFPQDLDGEPLLLPSARSGIRVAFDRVLEEAGIEPTIHAEVDDMAMLRLLARERDGIALVPPIVVRDELDSGILVELCTVDSVAERFFAIVQQRRFPNPLINELLGIEELIEGNPPAPTARWARPGSPAE